MRLANVHGRLSLVVDNGCIDVEKQSRGAFGSSPQAAFDRFAELLRWAADVDLAEADVVPFTPTDLGPPVPEPRQVFAVGLNYYEHARESGFVRPDAPLVFTKYPSSITGPVSTVELPTATVDWETELVVAIGQQARNVAVKDAWSHVAGLTVGQDLSERTSQHAGPAPQFSLAKSFPGFSPIGPVLVTPDEVADPEDLALGCEIDGAVMQQGRTSQMIFSVAELVSHLSSVITLWPGDLIFTGTPAGVGAVVRGDLLEGRIEGLGNLNVRIV